MSGSLLSQGKDQSQLKKSYILKILKHVGRIEGGIYCKAMYNSNISWNIRKDFEEERMGIVKGENVFETPKVQ